MVYSEGNFEAGYTYGVKFGMEKWTIGPSIHAKFHLIDAEVEVQDPQN